MPAIPEPRPGLRCRRYGSAGPLLVLLHGGPGAGWYLAPLARALADSFRILEPLQRRSGGQPLTVAAHVQDLEELLNQQCQGEPVAVLGHSWGAMLALACAAAHPRRVRSLSLVGCGTFDARARERMGAIIEARMDAELSRRIDLLSAEHPDPDQRLRAFGELTLPLYSYDADASVAEVPICDARGHDETWRDQLRLQLEGRHPCAFAAIQAPVLMLHGAADPHPGRLIRDSLLPHLPRLEYREWERCGHYPWLETAVRDEFLAVLRQWLLTHSGENGAEPD